MRTVTKRFQSLCASHIGLAPSLNLSKDENELFSSSGKQLCRTLEGNCKEKTLLGKQKQPKDGEKGKGVRN